MEALKIIFKRVGFFFLTVIPISCVAIMLNRFGIFSTKKEDCFILIFGTIIFLIINFFALRTDFSVMINKGTYFLFNIFSVLIFFVITFVLFIFLPSNIFVWPFGLMRFLCFFSNYKVSQIISFLAFNGLLFICVIFAPIAAKEDFIE